MQGGNRSGTSMACYKSTNVRVRSRCLPEWYDTTLPKGWSCIDLRIVTTPDESDSVNEQSVAVSKSPQSHSIQSQSSPWLCRESARSALHSSADQPKPRSLICTVDPNTTISSYTAGLVGQGMSVFVLPLRCSEAQLPTKNSQTCIHCLQSKGSQDATLRPYTTASSPSLQHTRSLPFEVSALLHSFL